MKKSTRYDNRKAKGDHKLKEEEKNWTNSPRTDMHWDTAYQTKLLRRSERKQKQKNKEEFRQRVNEMHRDTLLS